jgi:enoyl-CoA hydratase
MAHGKANALDLEFCNALAQAFRDAAHARAVVLTGTGRIFSAGVDLPRVLGEGKAYTRDFLRAMDECFLALFTLERPAVAAINGHGIAGGCVLACACDSRLMVDEGATIGVPELGVGVPFPPVAMEILRHGIGTMQAQRLIVSCENLAPARALKTGLVDELAPADALNTAAHKQARRLAAMPPGTFALVKHGLRSPVLQHLASVQDHARAVAEHWQTDEVRTAIGAFVEGTLRKSSPG